MESGLISGCSQFPFGTFAARAAKWIDLNLVCDDILDFCRPGGKKD
jgi:hypothetical protein